MERENSLAKKGEIDFWHFDRKSAVTPSGPGELLRLRVLMAETMSVGVTSMFSRVGQVVSGCSSTNGIAFEKTLWKWQPRVSAIFLFPVTSSPFTLSGPIFGLLFLFEFA